MDALWKYVLIIQFVLLLLSSWLLFCANTISSLSFFYLDKHLTNETKTPLPRQICDRVQAVLHSTTLSHRSGQNLWVVHKFFIDGLIENFIKTSPPVPDLKGYAAKIILSLTGKECMWTYSFSLAGICSKLFFFSPINIWADPLDVHAEILVQWFVMQSALIQCLILTLRRLMSYIYIYGAPILDVSRSHTTTQHSR